MVHIPIAEFVTQAQLDEYRELVFEDTTAVLQLTQEATRNSYDAIAIPITNEAWRKRWREMCLTDEHRTGLSPEIQRRAECWRGLCGPFVKSELSITRLGACNRVYMMQLS
jgi:type II protein arginine methyltransferase